jgi:thiamine biosynthesis lipoprotein ApbE
MRSWHTESWAFSVVASHQFDGCGAVGPAWEETIFREETMTMEYMIEPVGAQFSSKAVTALAQKFTSRAAEGYRLHSVFQVAQPGCLGLGQGSVTYLAVYVKGG